LRKSNNRLETHCLFHETWWFFAVLENNWNQWLVFFDSDFLNTWSWQFFDFDFFLNFVFQISGT
jgi:hypothetical protein